MLKVELHTHTSDDPVDRIPHTLTQLVDRAAYLGYHALAITLHDRQLDLRPFLTYAADRGIVLIPGMELSIEGRHTLLLNFRSGAEDVRTFDDLARLKQRQPGLVVAPHPFFPGPTCLGDRLERYASLFDAVPRRAMGRGARQANRRQLRRAPASPARNHVFTGRRRTARRQHLRGDCRGTGARRKPAALLDRREPDAGLDARERHRVVVHGVARARGVQAGPRRLRTDSGYCEKSALNASGVIVAVTVN